MVSLVVIYVRSPFSETILATSSKDRRLCVWDIERIGGEVDEEDVDIAPELLVRRNLGVKLYFHQQHIAIFI